LTNSFGNREDFDAEEEEEEEEVEGSLKVSARDRRAFVHPSWGRIEVVTE